jgi:hypothetical protein
MDTDPFTLSKDDGRGDVRPIGMRMEIVSPASL